MTGKRISSAISGHDLVTAEGGLRYGSRDARWDTQVGPDTLEFAMTKFLQRKIFWTGVFLVSLYNLLSAAQEVFIGKLTQRIDPIRMVFWGFLITVLFFQVVTFKRKKLLLDKVKRNTSDFFWINVTTCIAWITFYFSLKYVEPAIVASMNGAISPLVIVLFSWRFRPSTRILPAEIFSAIGILIALIGMSWFSLAGQSALGTVPVGMNLIGILAAAVCGIVVAFTALISKRLYEAGISAEEMMASRFYLLIITTLGICLSQGTLLPGSVSESLSVLLVSIFGVIISLFVLQKGVEKSEPMTVSLLISAGPLFTLPLQLFDERLQVSISSIIIILLLFGFVTLGIVARDRSYK